MGAVVITSPGPDIDNQIRSGPVSNPEHPSFEGGRNIAMKVPPHQWQQTVAFYRDALGLRELGNPFGSGPQSVGFAFGVNRLWIDRVPGMSQAELWLQVTTADTAAAADHLAAAGVRRCDEIEPLDSDSAFWIASPAAIVHLVSEPDPDM